MKQHGGYLYEVTLDILKLAKQENSHIGDMGIIELLMFINNQEDRKTWIKKYWDGEMLYKPCIEALINKVIVKNILLHRKKPIISEFPSNCIHKYMVEYNTEYISLLNKLQS